MISPEPASENPTLQVGNYAAAFIDLLGQRVALRGQTLLPEIKTEEDKQRLIVTLKKSVGAIANLQMRAAQMMKASEPSKNSHFREALDPRMRAEWDETMSANIATQRWSDGLLLFTSIADDLVKCPVNGIFRMFALAGAVCFMGLAAKQPLRGAIEVSWGVELHPGELYGAAVARAYELESEVADYPRIVVGPHLINYLDLQSSNPSEERNSQINRALASLCKEMLMLDADGHWVLHYLGTAFRDSVTESAHKVLCRMAFAFINSQILDHQRTQNTKLAFRYARLHQYFAAHM